jgi:hypothetical protein
MRNLLKHIFQLVRGKRRRRIYEQLQWQRFLLRTGIPATAEVLDLVQEESEMSNYVQMRIWVMLKLKGTVSYQHIQTLLNKKDIPVIGQTIHIRYCADDMSNVIIV